MITASRYHDISCGHRVHNHESKCALLHGHNYRIHFTVAPEVAQAGELSAVASGCARTTQLDEVGRVLDFSVIKSLLCEWLEDNWDHRFLAWDQDPIIDQLLKLIGSCTPPLRTTVHDSIVRVPFNPTAENMAAYLLTVVGPQQLSGTGCKLISVTVEETRKCFAGSAL